MTTPQEAAHELFRRIDSTRQCMGGLVHAGDCSLIAAAIETARADGIVSTILCHGSPFESAQHLRIDLRSVVLATDRVRG